VVSCQRRPLNEHLIGNAYPGEEPTQQKGGQTILPQTAQRAAICPTRLREKKMRRFKSGKQTQRFLSAFGPISEHFQPRRHRLRAAEYRAIFQRRFLVWNEVTRVKQAA
jgi:putative transposase